jgi:hypothetical protein
MTEFAHDPESIRALTSASVEPFTSPHPDEYGLGPFYEHVLYSEGENPTGLRDQILLATSEPIAHEGETLSDVMSRLGREYTDVTSARNYRKGPSEVAFYKDHYVPPVIGEPLVAPPSKRTAEGLLRHIIAIQDKNEHKVDPNSLVNVQLDNPYIAPGCRYVPFFGWDTHHINKGNAALGDKKRVREGVENIARIVEATGWLANSGNVNMATRPHPSGLAPDVNTLAEVEHDPRVRQEFLEPMIRNWRTWTADRDHLQDVPLGERATYGKSTRMEDGTFLEAAGTDNVRGPRQEDYAGDLKMARELVKMSGLSGQAAEEAVMSFFDELRGGASQGTDFFGGQCLDGKTLYTISTRKRLSVRVNSALAFDAYMIAKTLEDMGDMENALVFYQEVAQTAHGLDRWLHDGNIYRDRYADLDAFAEPDASMVDPLYFGLSDLRHGQGVVNEISDYIHRGGIATTLNEAEMNWRFDGSFAMTSRRVIRALARFGHGVGGDVGRRALDLSVKGRRGYIDGNLISFQETGTVREQISARNPEVPIVSGGEFDEYATLGEFVPGGMEYLAQLNSDPRDLKTTCLPLGYLILNDLARTKELYSVGARS